MFAAMPAMKEAISPVIASPSMPLGNRSRIRYSIELLEAKVVLREDWALTPSVPATAAIMPGTITMNGTNIMIVPGMIAAVAVTEVDHDERHEHLGVGADDRRALRSRH